MWGIFGDWRRFRHSRCYFCRARQQGAGNLQHVCSNCGAEWRPGGDEKGYWVRGPSSTVSAERTTDPAENLHSPRPHSGQRGGRRKRDVDFFTDKLVMTFLFIPFFPWVMWLFGQDELPSGGEIPGLLLLGAFSSSIALAVAWHVGGRDYIVECICWTLGLAVLLPWIFVVTGDEAAPTGPALQRVLVTTVGVVVVVLAVARAFRIWPFEDKETRDSRHVAAVLYADPAGEDAPYLARCKCGWMGQLQKTEEAALAEAERHTPNLVAEWSQR